MPAIELTQIVGTVVGGAIGGTAAVAGLSKWLGEVWLGRILTKEKAQYDQQLEQLKAGYEIKLEQYKDALDRSKNLLRAQIDGFVFVTRAHFESEFSAYKEIFENLGEVRLLMPAMHPQIEVTHESDTSEEKLKRLLANLKQLEEAHNKAVRTVEYRGPFYPEDILDRLSKCLQLVRAEILHVQTGGNNTFSPAWHVAGEKRVQDFLAAYHQASDAVRQRIATLKILPNAASQ